MASMDTEKSDITSAILVSENISNKSGSFTMNNASVQPIKKWNIERSNLMNIAKICIKTLIDESMSFGTGRVLTEDFPALEQFFIVLEHIVRHGLKERRKFLGSRKEFLEILESMESRIPSLSSILANMKNLSTIKTNIGKMRAWMRLALMQKVLAEQMIVIVEEKGILKDWYVEESMLLSEEGSIIAGMLVGLNVIDCNFDLKGIDLDSQNGVIDISLYLRDGNYLEKSKERTSSLDQADGQKMEVILDQKAYLEQLNRSLSESVASLKEKAKQHEDTDNSVAVENEELRSKLACVIAEREQYKRDYQKLLDDHNKRVESFTADFTTERETYEQSRTGLNDLYIKARNDLEQEKQQSKESRLMLEEQRAINNEKQIAMRLLEKDIHDKQDTLIALRKQLEDIKRINLELHNKWQSSETSLKKHENEWSAMEQKCSRMIAQTKEMEKSLNAAEIAKKIAEETTHQIGSKSVQLEAEKSTLQTDMKIEQEWRIGLQAELNMEKEKNEKLAKQLKDNTSTIKESEELRKRLEKAELRCSEQESALYEMGTKLNKSHSENDEIKELQAAMKEKIWQDDRNINGCQQCNQSFSLSRRKHHCRNCGGIYCNSCSDNTMSLPSSAKPVRVCDMCYDNLLSRYNSSNK